jgi:nucleotide-binding universal stress UspA family protein
MKILIPIDFTRQNLCQMRLLNFIQEAQDVHLLHVISKNTNAQTRADLQHKMSQLISLHNTHRFTFQLLEESKSVGTTITEFAEKEAFDMLVVNVKNQSRAEKLWFGTELLKIIRQATCPVLCLPDKKIDFSFKKAAFFTDLSEESVIAFRKFEKILQLFHIPVEWIKVTIPSNFQTTRQFNQQTLQIKQLFNPEWQHSPKLINDYSVEEGIQHYIRDENIDLAMFASHGRTGISLYYYGSVTENIIENLTIPALITGIH